MQSRPIPYDRPVIHRRSVVVALWYALIAGLAWWGFALAVHSIPADLVYFSNITLLAVGVAYSALVVAEVRDGAGRAGVVARGACAMYCVVVAIIFNTLLDADLSSISSLLAHAVVPALVVVDWLAVRRRGSRLSGGVIVPWMLIPLLYIPVYTLNDKPGSPGVPIYGFLDPRQDDYWPMVCGFAGFFLVVGLVMWALRTGARRQVPNAQRGEA